MQPQTLLKAFFRGIFYLYNACENVVFRTIISTSLLPRYEDSDYSSTFQIPRLHAGVRAERGEVGEVLPRLIFQGKEVEVDVMIIMLMR